MDIQNLMEPEGTNFEYAIADSSPSDSLFENNTAPLAKRSNDFDFYVRYVAKDLWKRMSFSRNESVTYTKQMCLTNCGITSQKSNISLPTLFSPYTLSDRETEANSDEFLLTETDWTTEYGLYWPAAGHWLDDSRRLATYQFGTQDIIEIQHRNSFILLPTLNYFESYAEGYLLKKCGKGISQCWSLRWFCLRGAAICYSRRAKDCSSAIINIHDRFVFVEGNHFKSKDENSWQFSIQLGSKTLDLKVTTLQEYEHWRRIFKNLQTRNLEERTCRKQSLSIESATASAIWSKSAETSKCLDSFVGENKPRPRSRSFLTRHEIFSKSSHSFAKPRKESIPEPKRIIPVRRAYFQLQNEPEFVYIGFKPKMAYIFGNSSHHNDERCMSLSNAWVEVEYSTGRFMFVFNIKSYAEDRISPPDGIIGRLYVESDAEMKMWLVEFTEAADMQISLGNIKSVIFETIPSNRSAAPVSEFDDGYSTSPPTTPTSLSGSEITNFPFTPSKYFTPSRQSLRDDYEEVYTARPPSVIDTTKHQSEDIDMSRYGTSAPTPFYLSPYRVVKKTSQRFPTTFWRRRGSII
ncbi:hypothetical protein K7432_003665 [Basidiobolus ranarum]|uniref:PH domain-containing protein n=1 Tax=Basidiobolus ranarum TaxID=34480 RepID=A0ABR2W5R5_9FUNG